MLKIKKTTSSFAILLCLFLSGCATEYHPLETTPEVTKPAPKKEGVYHKVLKGQTLFRIAKAYAVDIDDIISANNIPNAAAIEVNQLVFIPGVKRLIDIPEGLSTTPSSVVGSPAVDPNKDEFAWPLKGKLTGYFNDRKGDAVNKGIDIEAGAGDAIKASREGKVVLSDYLGSWGYTVILDHGDGFLSVYSHLANLNVKLGDHVYKADPIAQLAQIGSKAMLHFQIRKGQIAVNPLYYLP